MQLDDAALDVARGSLERTELFVLGEFHGIAETASAILTLVRRLGVRVLGLEWSFNEVGAVLDELMRTGRFDLDAIWSIPAVGDLFAGDGRFTAELVRVLEHQIQSGELTAVVPIDRLDEEPPLVVDREIDMAERLLAHRRPGDPMLVVPGYFHASRTPFDGFEPMFVHLERALPGLANGALEFGEGASYSRGEQSVRPLDRPFDAVYRLERATPATVPARRA